MQNQYRLAERAVLMRMSAGMPGKARKDRGMSDKVKAENHLGQNSGAWVKNRFPDWALEPIEKIITKAREYHAAVTYQFDAGIGILPAALIMEYGDRMRQFAGQIQNKVDTHFVPRYPEIIAWARTEHNGTFDESDYPPIEEMVQSFYFKTEPLPVPDASHFETTVKSLLGVDTQSVDMRVADAMQETQRELIKRLIEPVRAMATRLSEQPKEGKTCPKFNDTLVSNVRDIANLAPKMNISGDPRIDNFVREINALLAPVSPDTLRKSANTREQTALAAKAMLSKLEAYKI